MQRPLRAPDFHPTSTTLRAQVRFFALRRIKPHAPPLVRAPVNSFEFQPCAPSFRASASVAVQRAAFATDVPPDIYAFHRYTGNSTLLSRTLARQFLMPALG